MLEHKKETLMDRLKSNGPVTAGVVITAGALGYGLKSMKSGDPTASNRGMTVRVAAQATTLALICGFALNLKLQQDEIHRQRDILRQERQARIDAKALNQQAASSSNQESSSRVEE
mmetsp:Transcript_20162/g.29982  ORF Transcript_20162/g.29982 Transcript_20162/m.29982 type:complete len:116 (+) Transcript_20162:35-382(+)|eukprot:CAMPEP_0201544900 /NCGR_PEP_ID=MMETSP0173_2-20130828/1520_1 /ASSEMBLY_ACC=CAM_ASM_000268 /TAXON_ID=218659 /ORGANISM="Vexillifera sp., Strain DIVA3 564/2" /LENGTH=115 /DNA_ID=CAMNT_0047953181 /DNA_START=35 /DNA_END=382 /DNA_ORIENTATION=+